MTNIFDIFKKVTRFDIESYLSDFSQFILSDYQQIVDFYQKGSDLEAGVVDRVKSLYQKMREITDLFNIFSDRLSTQTVEIWELLDVFETTKVTLLTVINSDRWMRSTKNIFQNNQISRDFILKQGQSFEHLSMELGHADQQNDWSYIALNNNIREEDYSLEGGNKLKVSFVNNQSFSVDTVIDSISGKKLYGLDVDRSMVFENNDLKILDYKETIIQQTEILVGLIKGSVPEFPFDGIDKGLSGSNVNAIQYPTLLRQQSRVFEKDGRYRSISVDTFDVKVDSLIVNFKIVTRLGEVLDEQLVLA